MDRMKLVLITICWVVGLSAGQVIASDGDYIPAYETSPSAKITPTPTAAPVATKTTVASPAAEIQPEISCNLKVTLPRSMKAPVEAKFLATGKIDGQAINSFRFLFGDGESATGSGETKHVYSQQGTYQVRVMPVVDRQIEVPICKAKVEVKAGEAIASPSASSSTQATETVIATSAAIKIQPKTGPGLWYWMSLATLSIVWLGALSWHQNQRPVIG